MPMNKDLKFVGQYETEMLYMSRKMNDNNIGERKTYFEAPKEI
jgi:hypothetical protein